MYNSISPWRTLLSIPFHQKNCRFIPVLHLLLLNQFLIHKRPSYSMTAKFTFVRCFVKIFFESLLCHLGHLNQDSCCQGALIGL